MGPLGSGPSGGASLEYLTLRRTGEPAHLDLSDNCFVAPEGLHRLSNVRWLPLRGCRPLSTALLPPAVTVLQHCCPTWICRTPILTQTACSTYNCPAYAGCPFVTVACRGQLGAWAFFTRPLPDLTHLYLSDNMLGGPHDIEGLFKLEFLDLSSNFMAELPELTALSALQELNLANCPMKVTAAELHSMLEHMPGLTRLSLNDWTAEHVTNSEWVQLAHACPRMELKTFGDGE